MFEYEIQINKPVREVYQMFNDPDNLPRWLSGLQRHEQISGRPGEVGSKSRQIYLERGRTIEMIETVTAHEPEKHFAGRIEGQGVSSAIEVDFVDCGPTTLMRLRSGLESRGFLMSLMMPFVRTAVRKRQEGDLQRFKQLVETGETATES